MGSELGGHDVLQQCWHLLLFDGLLAYILKITAPWDVYCPNMIPTATGLGVASTILTMIAFLACVGSVVTFVRCGPYHRPHIFFPLYTMAMLARIW